jgi:single-strand DNA-binding protein
VSYQNLVIVGRLGRDPELRYTPSGQAVASFSVATSRKYKTGDGQQVDETTWFRVSVWGKQAETCNQYLSKGKMVLVEGRLTPDKETGSPKIWTRQDGTPGTSFEVSANTVRFLSPRDEVADGYDAPSGGMDEPDAGSEDIPF